MPYHIRKRNGQFCVENSDTGKRVACHPSRAQALAQMRALYAAMPEARGKTVDDAQSLLSDAMDLVERSMMKGSMSADDMTLIMQHLRGASSCLDVGSDTNTTGKTNNQRVFDKNRATVVRISIPSARYERERE